MLLRAGRQGPRLGVLALVHCLFLTVVFNGPLAPAPQVVHNSSR